MNFKRKTFLKAAGVFATGFCLFRKNVFAGNSSSLFNGIAGEKQDAGVPGPASIFQRGTKTIYTSAKDELKYIGMPVGGICAGQLYLGGDGQLWHWDIFNEYISTGGSHYFDPLQPGSTSIQSFSITIDGKAEKPINKEGFKDISFRGEYPIGTIVYKDAGYPLEIKSEVFSPFIPLNIDDSSLPATIIKLTITNRSDKAVQGKLTGLIQNAVCNRSGQYFKGERMTKHIKEHDMSVLFCTASPQPENSQRRPTIVFANFEGNDYGDWHTDGVAFGNGPAHARAFMQHLSGFEGNGWVNTRATGGNAGGVPGKLRSPDFIIGRKFIRFLIGGKTHGKTCINLLAGNEVVRTATGKNDQYMDWFYWDVNDLTGKTAAIEIEAVADDSRGRINVDQIEFTDEETWGTMAEQHDFGTMAFATLNPQINDTRVGSGHPQPLNKTQTDGMSRHLFLPAGKEQTITFILSWHFPNLTDPGPGRYYATRFKDAYAVARYVATNFDRLATQTCCWCDTWYDSSLPYWFLDRTFANTSTLATSTAYRFVDGRFWGYEGVGSCPGTCTHVWHYEQAMGRLFPQLDINLRERTEYNPARGFGNDGQIAYRSDTTPHYAIDGQAGTILRTYRDHQMSADDLFLTRNWAAVRKSIQWLIDQDGTGNGILKQKQFNTLDAEWYGSIPWLSGLYLAALKAGEQMAKEVGDQKFAALCAKIASAGKINFVKTLYNGEYFEQVADAMHKDVVGSYNGCHIDQVMGQGWAFQVGLGRVLPQKETRQALTSIWKHNMVKDLGTYRKERKLAHWELMKDESGLLVCSWPKGEQMRVPGGFDGYFNECMNGFEYQVAGHMIWEGMIEEGFMIVNTINDRYHAAKRNPWNEIEAGDHYARSMASYGVFLAACGFEYNGPKRSIGFAPKVLPDNFKAAFTTSSGWGVFTQKRYQSKQVHSIGLKYGTLQLKSLAFEVKDNFKVKTVNVLIDMKKYRIRFKQEDNRLLILADDELMLHKNETMTIHLS